MDRINKYKYPGAKRLMLEAQELKDNTEDYWAQPIEDNLFEWHFTVRGPPETVFDGGFYHGRISFPTDYPMKPPSIILLTPNGRFETNKKICLSISGYHPETWQPSWSIRTALLALIAFMPTKANGAIGSLDLPDMERKRLAKKSQNWKCQKCGLIKDLLVQPNQTSFDNSNDSDRLSEIPYSDHKQQSVDYSNDLVTKSINTASTSNITLSKNSNTGSLEQKQKGNNLHKFGTKCDGSQDSSTNSSQMCNGSHENLIHDISTNVETSHQLHMNSSSQDSMNDRASIPQFTPYRRSYSMIIFSMAVMLVVLILRRLFFVVL